MSDQTSVEEPAADGPKRRGQVSKKHTVGTVLVASLLALGLVTGLSVVFIYRHLNGNITVSDAFDQVDNRPEREADAEALNVLVMGSDTREGEGNEIDGESGMGGSDTTILLHLSADRERAYGVSIPRDSLVTRPDCEDASGNLVPGGEDQMWNAAYALGGEACTIEQFELNTGIYVDDFVVVDFNGFKDMVDAVGGVPVCIPEDIDDPAHDIFIKGGDRVLKGDEALDYVRVRYVGNKSDLGRIKRQQNFIAGMINEVVSAGTLARPDKLVGFLNAATSSLTVSPGLDSLSRLGKLGLSVQDVGLDNIQFVTVPWQPHPSDPNRIGWLPEAEKLWKKIAADKPLTRELTSGAINAQRPPGSAAAAPTTPSSDGTASSDGDEGSGQEASGEEATEPESESPIETPSATETPSVMQPPTVTAPPTAEEIEEAENNGLCV